MYDIAQDLVLLKNHTDGRKKATIEILRHYYDDKGEDQNDPTFFTDKIKEIYMKRENKLTDAFLKIKEVCDYFCFLTKNYTNLTEKYNTAYYNILVGTYFHGDCKYLDPSSTPSETSPKPSNTRIKSKKKSNAVKFFKEDYSVYLDISFEDFDQSLVKMIFPTHENFTETFEDNPTIDSIKNDEQFADIRRNMKNLFIALVGLYGFEYDQNHYKFSDDNNIWNLDEEVQKKYLIFLPEMVKSLLFFNQDHADIFIHFLETLKDELQDHDSYRKLMEEIEKIQQG